MAWIDVSVCCSHPVSPGMGSARSLLRTMDAADVQQAWICGYEAIATHDFRSANECVAQLAKAHPERFVPIGLVNPMYPFPELDRLLDDGFRGIKILTGWGNWLTVDNIRREVWPIVDRLHGHGCHLSQLRRNQTAQTGRVGRPG